MMWRKIQVLQYSVWLFRHGFSQEDEVFGENTGNQCVGMSLTAIAYHHLEHNSLWRSLTLNRILTIGNTLYTSTKCSVQTNDYLMLTDVPSESSIYNKVFTLHYSDSSAGELHLTSNHNLTCPLKIL